jgi:hypothetical protein
VLVTGVATQPEAVHGDHRTTRYRISTARTTDSNDLVSIGEFDGNHGATGTVRNDFATPVIARILRLTTVQKHGGYNSMRMEMYGFRDIADLGPC